MPNDVVDFAIHAEDCQRAKRFYETVFGWRFEPWGPPEFWRVPVTGEGIIGFQCTIAVDDGHQIGASIGDSGGKITLPPFEIEGVGTLLMFEDTEGNVVRAMQYLEGGLQN